MKLHLNDGGRKAAGYKGRTGDCVARAIAIAADRPYRQTYDELAAIQSRMPKTRRRKKAGIKSARDGIYVRSKLFKDYMTGLGFTWVATMRIGSGCTVHLVDGELPMGRLVVSLSRHYTVVIDGVIHDTYDPQRKTIMVENGVSRIAERCVYGYWKLA